MVTHLEDANLETTEPDCQLPAQAATRHVYLDVIDAAYLLRRTPCRLRLLAETGLIPAHALRHEGLTCWKFRLDELLCWASEMDVELGQQAVGSLLRLRAKPQ